MARRGEIISHWHFLADDMRASALNYYTAVEEELKRREVPAIQTERVDWREGGVTTAKREYLRVRRERLTFDLCAAPFGAGYFFSWWLAVQRSPYAAMLGYVGLVVILGIAFWLFGALGIVPGLIVFLAALAAGLATVEQAAREGTTLPEDVVQSMLVVGPLYERVFKPVTYYSLDTTIMFQESVRRAVNTVIAGERSGQGLRALSPEEERPQMRSLLGL
jgi:hypothetical protein